MSSAVSTRALTPAETFPCPTPSMHLEFEIVLACSSACWDSQAELRLRDLLSTDLDWSLLLELGEQHGVLPLVQNRLATCAALVPAAIRDDLKGRRESHLRRALCLSHLLHSVNGALAHAGLCALAYKGPLLAQMLYGDVAMRQFCDLDFFLPPQDIPQAIGALRAIGLIPHTILRPAEFRQLITSGYELTLDIPGNQNVVEVKWRVAPRFYAVDFCVQEFLERTKRVDFLGTPILTLSDEDLFLVLCIHAAKHAWGKLSWICDIGRLTTASDLNWRWIASRAAALGIERIVGISLFLARELLNSETPASLKEFVGHDPQVELLGKQLIRDITSARDLDSESVAYFSLMLKIRERATDRIRFIMRLIATPTVTEWSMIKLPAPLFPLYRVLRLLRLVGRSLRLTRR
jgi:hypothetical protein